MTVDESTIAFANKLADAAGAAIRPYFRRRIVVTDKGAGKAEFDPVTEADKNAEAAIRALLKAERPEDGILGEEFGEQPGSSGRVWVLDPIDGTRGFITGTRQWGTLIALTEAGAPVLGILDQPVTYERFLGTASGSFLKTPEGTERLEVRPCAGLKHAVLASTHPWSYFTQEEALRFRRLDEAARLSRFGMDCYAYGLLAAGFLDVVVEARLNPWDIQPLIPIIEGAGGIVTDWQGKPCPHGGRVIAAGDKRVHEEALKVLADG